MLRIGPRALGITAIAFVFLFSTTVAASGQLDAGLGASGPSVRVQQSEPDGPMTEKEIEALVNAVRQELETALRAQEERMLRLVDEVPEQARPAVKEALKRAQGVRERTVQRVSQNLERVKSNMLRARANFERAQERAADAQQKAGEKAKDAQDRAADAQQKAKERAADAQQKAEEAKERGRGQR